MSKDGEHEGKEVSQRNANKWEKEIEGLPCGAAKRCTVDITDNQMVTQ
jgi:hypothetical protein